MRSYLRYAVRLLLKSPGFTITTILIMGLGIGATTAIFSVVHAVLLQSLPYPEPDKLFMLTASGPAFSEMSVAYPDYLDWRADQQSCDDLGAYRVDDFNLTGNGEPERVRGAFVTASYFRVLGVAPLLGQAFAESCDRTGGANVVVLGERFWRNRFAADTKVIGKTLTLNDISYQVIGVASGALINPRNIDIYVPFGFYADRPYLTDRDAHPGLYVIGRLKHGVSVAELTADLSVIARNLELRYPKTNAGNTVKVTSLLESTVGQYRLSLFLLLGVVGFVLLISCANIANLLLARSILRQREIAVRTALGASRGRIFAQLLAESLLLALLGGAFGVILAVLSTDAIVALAPHEIPRFQQVHVSGAVLLFSIAVTLSSGVLCGIWPAWKASRPDLNTGLESGGSRGIAPGRQRSQPLLVMSQVALASLLLMGAGLLIQSFRALHNVPLGFDPRHLLTIGVKVAGSSYRNAADEPGKVAELASFYDQLSEELQGLPGVKAVAQNTNLPFNAGEIDFQMGFGLTDNPDPRPNEVLSTEYASVSPNYFHAMGIQLLRGRSFNAEDDVNKTPVAIIDESFASQVFPGQDALGKQIWDSPGSVPRQRYTIVGVVRTVRHNDLKKQPLLQLYLPVSQRPELQTTIVLRTQTDPLDLSFTVRQAVQSVDPNLPVFNIRTMESLIASDLATERFSVVLASLFSVLALILAAVGLYGVLAYSIAQRRREIGVRIALGARSANILGMVIRQGLAIVAVGLAIGLIGAIGLTQVIQNMLYGVSATDPAALISASAVLGSAAFLACLSPALNATRIDPIAALRE